MKLTRSNTGKAPDRVAYDLHSESTTKAESALIPFKAPLAQPGQGAYGDLENEARLDRIRHTSSAGITRFRFDGFATTNRISAGAPAPRVKLLFHNYHGIPATAIVLPFRAIAI